MKILLTLDLDQPFSPERQSSEELLRLVWDQLQPAEVLLELLATPAKKLECKGYTVAEWAQAASKNEEQYREFAPSPLESYDLIIAANLAPAAENFFTALKIPTLILRHVPCEGFSRFLLARANFPIPETYCTQLPLLKNLYNQEIPRAEVTKEERHWWLANRFLVNQKSKDQSLLAIGTTTCQTERIVNGELINLHAYHDELIGLIPSYPNFYYCCRQPMDHSELRFMKTLNASCPSMLLPHLLSRDEINMLISIDPGVVPLAAAFQKPIKILGNHPSWSVIRLRQLRDREFVNAIAFGKLS